ncbi:hypothetical protein ZIOFF_040736 [Zingiber officinale]|uniref:Uncharacterized protein n=1 Tax=Zingiber officinale TaxID=94328 RepID=A0A8J5GG36_ZINOF|nr:hypothetical protein ZIOFF_040736 [Zingiber officinale]
MLSVPRRSKRALFVGGVFVKTSLLEARSTHRHRSSWTAFPVAAHQSDVLPKTKISSFVGNLPESSSILLSPYSWLHRPVFTVVGYKVAMRISYLASKPEEIGTDGRGCKPWEAITTGMPAGVSILASTS